MRKYDSVEGELMSPLRVQLRFKFAIRPVDGSEHEFEMAPGSLEVPHISGINNTAGWDLSDDDLDRMVERANEAILKEFLCAAVAVRVTR
jgi:hypothetical protein